MPKYIINAPDGNRIVISGYKSKVIHNHGDVVEVDESVVKTFAKGVFIPYDKRSNAIKVNERQAPSTFTEKKVVKVVQEKTPESTVVKKPEQVVEQEIETMPEVIDDVLPPEIDEEVEEVVNTSVSTEGAESISEGEPKTSTKRVIKRSKHTRGY